MWFEICIYEYTFVDDIDLKLELNSFIRMIMMLIFSSTRISWNMYFNIINQSKFKIYNFMKKGSWTQLQLDGNIVNKTIPIGISNFKVLSCFFIQKYLLKQWNYKKLHKFFSLIAPTLHLKKCWLETDRG